MPRSLVLGVNGQDGSYLAEALLSRGHHVTGIARDKESRYVRPSAAFTYVGCDLREPDALAALLPQISFDYAFHFAAVHGPSGFRYEDVWRDMMAVNVLSLHALLEHARRTADRCIRIVYGGSAKIFPAPLSGVIDETTPARATCLYGIGKMAARDLISFYRAQHGVNATNLVLFQHESPRRPPQYLLPTIARTIDRCGVDKDYRAAIKTLDFMIDWSDARELMDIAADVAEKSEADELVLASGTTWHARKAVQELFARYGLDYSRHLVEEAAPADPGPRFRVCLEKLERETGRLPARSLHQIVDGMIAASAGDTRPAVNS